MRLLSASRRRRHYKKREAKLHSKPRKHSEIVRLRNRLKIGARQEATLQILRMPTFLLQKSVNNASCEPKGNCGS